MKLRFLLDTNICIYIAKEKPKSVLAHFEKLDTGAVGMSLITYGELLFGAEKSNHPKRVKSILAELAEIIEPIPLSTHVAAHYAKTRAYLENRGTPIGNNDLWIASHALELNLTLVTNNEKEFKRVPHLKVVNWA
jgi:tRNA(fMet)-specific endonuclease VapC